MTITGRPSGPLVLTLDAGGTHFVFNAIKDWSLVLPEGIVLPAEADDLDRSLANLVSGLCQVRERADSEPAAVSFAFPGPADYRAGILGDLDNLPAYRGDVPLGPYLREKLGLPVFIHNDGDLFAAGVALHGELPALNEELARRGSCRRLVSVAGMTLGSGWGMGFADGHGPFIGASSTGMEIGACPYVDDHGIEETVSRFGLIRLFGEELARDGTPWPFTGVSAQDLPRQIARLAGAEGPGTEAAGRAFTRFAHAFAFGVMWAVGLLDPDLVVVGGGLAGAWDIFFPRALTFMQQPHASGRPRGFKRLFDLSRADQREAFLAGGGPVMERKKTGIVRSSLDTAEAVMRGAYRVAIERLP